MHSVSICTEYVVSTNCLIGISFSLNHYLHVIMVNIGANTDNARTTSLNISIFLNNCYYRVKYSKLWFIASVNVIYDGIKYIIMYVL